jgi:NAD(P)H dehydrogenase (quinone)
MKNLIVFSHPNDKSFCAALKDVTISASREKNLDVELRDLYKLKFNPVLSADDFIAFNGGKIPQDIATEQSYIKQAEIITFVYPVWWTGLPAMVKGYIDKVFSYGFAYKVGEMGVEGLLKDKKVIVFNTTGTPYNIYERSGMIEAMKKTSDTGIFTFCGMTVLHHRFFGSVPYVDDAARKGYLEEARQDLLSL